MAEKEKFIYGYHEEGFNIPGCIANGISKEIAEKIYDQMIDFAKYAFNKSHAACYAAIAMQTAYLKANYPLEFASGLLTSVMDKTDKLAVYINEYRKKGLKILPPDINSSGMSFTTKDDSILYGLLSIKNIGRDALQEILNERESGGPYKDFVDFFQRNPGVNKRIAEYLIKSGAMDFSGLNRRTMEESFKDIISSLKKKAVEQIPGQMSLFDLCPEKPYSITPLPEYDSLVVLKKEKEATGFYISSHPMDKYKRFVETRHLTMSSAFIPDENGEVSIPAESFVTIAGILTSIKPFYTKASQELMAFVTLEDQTGSVDVVVFPRTMEKYGGMLHEDGLYCVRGTVKEHNGRVNVAANVIYEMESLPKDIYVYFPSYQDYLMNKNSLEIFAKNNEGRDAAIVPFIADSKGFLPPLRRHIKGDSTCISNAELYFGNAVRCVDTMFWN